MNVKKLLRPVLLMVMMVLTTLSVLAQGGRGPSTPAERDTAVKAARLLGSEPFHKDAKKMREWFTIWLIQVPDIQIELCSAYLGPVGGSKKNYSSEIVGQMMFSSAAFIIEHPEQANDRVAVNLAGVEGALKVYEAILKAKPKAQWEFLDSLIAKQAKGELNAYVQDVTQNKCTRK
ncbi:MAG: hypothetical protein ABI596_16715 [Pyrinomonadaceae bacterium]